MENIFIYTGLGVLLLGTLVLLFAAVKGFILTNKKIDSAEVKRSVSKITKPGFGLTIVGFVLIGIGIIVSLI
ncbi:MAG: hypothetical protein K2H76_02690 [Muribaculaceae bacterium]|nr:hypothetical protein [Muribaculaceae bacterium]